MKLKSLLALVSLIILPAFSYAMPGKCKGLSLNQITTCQSLVEYLDVSSLGRVKTTFQRESAGWGVSTCSSIDETAYSYAKKDYVALFRHYNRETNTKQAYCCVVETGDQLFSCNAPRN